MLSTEERRLLVLYQSGTADTTAAVMRDALPDITEPDEHAAAESVIRKLEAMGDASLCGIAPESVVIYE